MSTQLLVYGTGNHPAAPSSIHDVVETTDGEQSWVERDADRRALSPLSALPVVDVSTGTMSTQYTAARYFRRATTYE